jgi:hypothetical protein
LASNLQISRNHTLDFVVFYDIDTAKPVREQPANNDHRCATTIRTRVLAPFGDVRQLYVIREHGLLQAVARV